MKKKSHILLVAMMISIAGSTQHPLKHWMDAFNMRYSLEQPVINYRLAVDSVNYSFFAVDMQVRNVPDTFQVAMVAHPEYDDRYWRYIEDLSVDGKNGKGKIIRRDSSLWSVICRGGEAVLHYKIRLPLLQNPFRSSWKAFLTSTGGLAGGPHCFMYVVGATLAPSHVSLQLPQGWQVVTGLSSTPDPKIFFAPSVATLVDDPIFIGQFKSWLFTVDGIPHRLTYWPLPDAKHFDEELLLASIKKLVEQASLLFGRLPYSEFNFMLQDGALGSLEHNNSVTVGAPSDRLAISLDNTLAEIAHEYFHTWNLVRIHPVEYTDVDYKTPELSKGLWFSEGLTLFYADLLARRAGLPVFDSTRVRHLETLIRGYSSNPAYTKFSAEKISQASYAPAGYLGDYSGSTHLQGQILGAVLDLFIRNATNGKRSMDDVMRKMLKRFSGEKGFTSEDIEHVVSEVCGFNMRPFFLDHVFGNKPIDFSKYLGMIGLKYELVWKDVVDNDNKPIPDLRIFAYTLPGESITRIAITNPSSCWGRAGLHTGDIISTVNGNAILSASDFRNQIRSVKLGDTVSIEVQRPTGIKKVNVTTTAYQNAIAHISPTASPTEKQLRLYKQWISGE